MPRRFQLSSPRIKLSENDVERQCMDILGVRGYKPYRHHVGRFRTIDGRWITMGETGEPDYIVIHPRFPGFLLEVKATGKPPSSEQVLKIIELQRGYRLAVAVVDSVEALADWLRRHERSP